MEQEEIKEMIYELRGEKVILASDLAKLYNCKNGTKEVNQAVKNNIERFPISISWILSDYEVECFLVKKFDQKKETRGGRYKMPRVFTIECVKVLATIFKSENVREITTKILEAFKDDFEDELEYEIIKKSPELREESIRNMIYEINGKQVMLDEDLAKLYKCKNGTKEVNQAVKNNIDKFPTRYSWVISDYENLELRSKFLTANYKKDNSMKRFNPRVFTEEGIVMLATILKTSVAVQVTIAIIDTFVLMRKYISNNLIEQRYINNQVFKNTEDIKLLQESFKRFEEKKVLNEIYFNGQIYDAYSKIVDLLNEAKQELIIIDGYADKCVLDMISKLKVKVILVLKSNSLISKLDLEKYYKQYNNLKILYDDTWHDRYLIIDKVKVYHLGASINHIGSKTFSINTIGDKEIINLLISKVGTKKSLLI